MDKAVYFPFYFIGLVVLLMNTTSAAVLPEDLVQVLYHNYSESNQDINGPAVLVQKKLGKKYAVGFNYLVDRITGASIDVKVLGSSAYSEERLETTLNGSYLLDKGILSVGIRNSEENDFTANSAFLSISQDVFGGMTTVNLGFIRGWDEIGMSTDPDFSEEAYRQHYRLGLTQVLTKNWLGSFVLEAITDQGFLNNPYRAVRYLNPSASRGFSFQGEVYPQTRTSHALSFFSSYFLPYRASFKSQYRYFTDTWGIQSHTLDLRYVHPYNDRWTFELGYRYYTQNEADFYSDLFPFIDAQTQLARDKELSALKSATLGVGLSYEVRAFESDWLKKTTVNFFIDRLSIDYENFRNLLVWDDPAASSSVVVGQEPFFNLDVTVMRFFVSIWF